MQMPSSQATKKALEFFQQSSLHAMNHETLEAEGLMHPVSAVGEWIPYARERVKQDGQFRAWVSRLSSTVQYTS
jgi:hypothetical protein